MKLHSHLSYGMIGAARVTTGPSGVVLNASRIRHRSFVKIEVREADQSRDLGQDWHYGRKTIVELWMSEAQWASFLTAMNVGFGVPCTLRYVQGEEIADPPIPEESVSQAKREFNEDLERLMARCQDLLAEIDQAVETRSIKKQREAIKNMKVLIQSLLPNMKFAEESFSEHVEHVVADAKASVESHFVAIATKAAQLGEAMQQPTLIEGGETK